MSTLPGHHRFTVGAFAVDWFDGGGFVGSHLVWRLGSVPVAIVLSGLA